MPETMEQIEGLMQFATGASDIGKIDRASGVVFGVAIITEGEAQGHGMLIDGTMLDQVSAAGQAAEPEGVKSRFDHPGFIGRSIGSALGRFHNFRRDGDKVRADLHIFKAAAKSPDGDLRDYVISMAEEDPDAFGMSIAFRMAEPEYKDDEEMPYARLDRLDAVDLVDTPSANRGLFKEDKPGTSGLMARLFSLLKKAENEEQQEVEMADQKLQEELSASQANVETLTATVAELQAKIDGHEAEKATSFDEGIAAGEEQAFGKIKARVDRYKDAGFVLETVEMSDEEVKDKWIERLEAAQAAADKALANADKGEGDEGVESLSGGDDPDENSGDEAKSLEERRAARVAELKAEGMGAEKAWKQVHSEITE